MSLHMPLIDLPLFKSAAQQNGDERPPDPPFVLAPSTPLQARYARFYRNNLGLFASLEKLALQQYREGATRLSIADMVEDLRKEARTIATGEAFAWNNSYRSFAARHLMYKHLELDGLFEIRCQTNSRNKGEAGRAD